MSDPDDDQDERGFFQTHKVWIILGLLLAAGAGGYYLMTHRSTPVAPRQERIVMLTLPPPSPKPIPTPPPVQPQPPDQKIVEKKTMTDDQPKDAPKPEPPKAPDEPPPSMGSNIKGDNPDGFGLNGSGNGGRVGLGGNGHGGGSAFGRYASQVQGRISEELRQNKQTRSAAFDLRVKLWIDSSGVISRAEPVSGEGAAAAAALRGVRLAERPPEGMPMPLLAHLAARRP